MHVMATVIPAPHSSDSAILAGMNPTAAHLYHTNHNGAAAMAIKLT